MSDLENTSQGLKLYKEAGVQVKKADQLVEWLKDPKIETPNHSTNLLAGIGGFAACFKPDFSQYIDPVLVSTTDGVGTKLLLAIENNELSGLGFDLVAMCVNDLYTTGAKPLFFLDYYACGLLDELQFKSVLASIKRATQLCGATLIGGETAELPGLYSKKHFDLAGFMVGLVDRPNILGPHKVAEESVLFALPSSGFHSNGYSLLRKWVAQGNLSKELLNNLLLPTTIYHQLPQIFENMNFKGLQAVAHITGGGIAHNLSRVIPDHLKGVIDWNSIQTPEWMKEIFRIQNVNSKDLADVFNLGIGMICIIEKHCAETFIKQCQKNALSCYKIGNILPRTISNQPIEFID